MKTPEEYIARAEAVLDAMRSCGDFMLPRLEAQLQGYTELAETSALIQTIREADPEAVRA